jgi:hypothetical protein
MPSETSAIGMDRKLAAIMFTDIVGFSRQMGICQNSLQKFTLPL